MLHDLRHVIGTLVNIRIGNDQQHAFWRALDQTASRFEYGDACPFGTDQRACNLKAILLQKVVQVVAGDATRNIWKALPDQTAIGIGDRFELGIDFGTAPALLENGSQFRSSM